MTDVRASTRTDHRSNHRLAGLVRERRSSMIYFLVDPTPDDTRVKIGYSSSPEGVLQRLKQHRSSNSRVQFYCAIDGDQIHEKRLHQHFAGALVGTSGNQETFHLTDDLQSYLEWLGEQPWAACSEAEVVDPWAHWDEPIMWPWQPRTSTNPTDQLAMFDARVAHDQRFGTVRAPLPVEERNTAYARDSNEWYTPACYVEAARRVMGHIDLDPATSHFANKTVRADRIYTRNDNGLAASNLWRGNVWLNPPYGGMQRDFLERLIVEHEAGHVPQAVVCLNGYRYDTRWFQPMWRYWICFTYKRVGFIGGASEFGPKTEDDNSPANGTVFVYLGDNDEAFKREFGEFGHCVRSHRAEAAA